MGSGNLSFVFFTYLCMLLVRQFLLDKTVGLMSGTHCMRMEQGNTFGSEYNEGGLSRPSRAHSRRTDIITRKVKFVEWVS